MLELTRWTPWTELAGLHRDLDTVFGSVFGETARRPVWNKVPTTLTPAAEIWRDGDAWKVWLAVPGVTPENVDIDMIGRTLRVRGERVAARKPDGEPIFSELPYGRFERVFTLPDEIDATRVEATYRHGMLELTLPLSEGAKPHRIPVYPASDARQLAAAR